MKNIDFLAVGDTVTDAFITLEDIRIDTDSDPEDQGQDEICFRFGDKLPYEELTITPGVGNAANAAMSSQRLGLNTALVTDIGGDTFGKQIIEYFTEEGLSTEYVRVHDDIPTNYHFVLSHNAERTILIKHQEYPYTLPRIEPPKTLYFSSVGEGTEEYHDAIADYTEAHPDILFAFQPGTFQMKLGAKRLARIYARANMVFANKEEYRRILDSKSSDVETLLKEMKELGPDTPILTDGRDGAYALTEEGIEHVSMFPDPAPPKERTGAGDAFSSTTAVLVTEGLSLKEAMKRGTVNSAYVVQKIGAQEGLLTREEIEEKLTDA